MKNFVEQINGFEISYREAGSNSYWRARRPIPEGRYEVYTRKNRASLIRFIKGQGTGGIQNLNDILGA